VRTLASITLATAALVLAACGSSGVAATVGDDTITIAALQSEVVAFVESVDQETALSGDLSGFQQELLTREINHLLLVELAEREGVEIDEADVDALLDELAQQAGGDLEALRAQFGYTEEGLRRAVEDEARLRALQPVVGDVQAALAQLSEEVGVELNPRYGEWDELSVQPGTGSISVPSGG
jgi:hypothetical protein